MKKYGIAAILIYLVLVTWTHAQGYFNPPDGLIGHEISLPPNAGILAAEKYVDEQELTQVMVLIADPMKTSEAADDFVGGIIIGMANKGLRDIDVREITHQGYPGMHITGKIPLGGDMGFYYGNCYILFDRDKTYNINYSRHSSVQDQIDILGRIDMNKSPASSAGVGRATTNIATMAGELTAYVLMAVVFIFVITKMIKKKKA